MKKIFILFIIVTFGCSTNRYLLTDKNNDKKYLSNYINTSVKDGKITNKPSIVIDGYAFSYDNLKTNRIQIAKADIKEIVCLSKDSKGANIYGDIGKNGVILILTDKIQEKSTKTISDSKVLFLIGEKQIPKSEFDMLVPADIESIEVIKEKDKIKKYTSDDYDGVVIITLKKSKTKNE